MEVVGVDGGGGDGRLDGGWLELGGKRVAGRLDGRVGLERKLDGG